MTDTLVDTLEIEYIPFKKLRPHAGNARQHSDKQITLLMTSISRNGFIIPVLVDAGSNIIAGHARVLAAKRLGLTKIPVIRVSHLTPEQQRAFVIADMCKHVAAAMYGVGARLDEQPDLLFTLRGADANDLIAGAGKSLKTFADSTRVLDDGDVAALFGLDMEEETLPSIPRAKKKTAKAKSQARSKSNPPPPKVVSVKKTVSAKKKTEVPTSKLPAKKSKTLAKVKPRSKAIAPTKKKYSKI